jgi:excisionase family DNA binding protein
MQSPTPKGEQVIEPALLSLSASAEFLSLSPNTLYRLIAAGKVKAVKHGAKTLLTLASLRDYASSLPEVKIKPPKSAA